MIIVWFVLGIVVGAFALFLLMGVIHLRQSVRAIEQAQLNVKEEEIPNLTEECIRVFREKLKKELSLNDYPNAARILDSALEQENLQATKDAFATHELYWRFVLPMGAFLGELVRANTSATWKPSPIGVGLALETQAMGFLHPFDKILKQVQTGDPGDLRFYVALCIKGTEGGPLTVE